MSATCIHILWCVSIFQSDAHLHWTAVSLQEACCGVDGYRDWRNYNTRWRNETTDLSTITPPSCCQANSKNGDSCNKEPDLEISQEVRMHMWSFKMVFEGEI